MHPNMNIQFDNNDIQYDVNSEIAIKMIEIYVGEDIQNICNNLETFGATAASNKSLSKLVTALKDSYYNIIKDYDEIRQELFLLHKICIGLYEFNKKHINYSYSKYRSIILFPNLIYLLVKYFHKTQVFLRKSIQKVHSEYSRHYYSIIQRYTNSYYIDDQVIQNDILCQFLGNALVKFNPLEIDKLTIFYHQIFRSSYFYYFRAKENFNIDYYDSNDIKFKPIQLNNVPTKLKLYKEILYDLQIKKMIENNPIMIQLNYNYNIFKNIVINNEFQNLYYSITDNIFAAESNIQFNLLNIYNIQLSENNQFLKKLQKLPIIFKLLKCIHIYSKRTAAYNSLIIQPPMVKTLVLEELMITFKQLFSEQYIHEILENIAQKFVDNILCGEYINPLTFNTFQIQDYSFANQLCQFIRLIISQAQEVKLNAE